MQELRMRDDRVYALESVLARMSCLNVTRALRRFLTSGLWSSG